MISPLIRYCILLEAKKNIKIPESYIEILDRYIKLGNAARTKILFSRLSSNSPLLSASGVFKGYIVFNAAWAIRVVFYDNEETLNAFKATIGHELTHQEKEMKVWSANYFTYLFKKRVNEVHADFGAVPKMLNNNRELALKAIEYKDNLKKKEKDSKFSDHPTWEQRYNYIKNYNFNKELIYKIADDMNYHNETIIEMVCEYYEDINLE